MKSDRGPGCIYFVQVGDDGPIKIGYSTNPARRLAALQASHPEVLHLIGLTQGSQLEEDRLHEQLAQWRIRGEWYAATAAVLAEIAEPLARVADDLERAVVAREHLDSAIAFFRGADAERGHEELQAVTRILTEVLA